MGKKHFYVCILISVVLHSNAQSQFDLPNVVEKLN